MPTGGLDTVPLNRVLPCEQFLFALVRFLLSVM